MKTLFRFDLEYRQSLDKIGRYVTNLEPDEVLDLHFTEQKIMLIGTHTPSILFAVDLSNLKTDQRIANRLKDVEYWHTFVQWHDVVRFMRFFKKNEHIALKFVGELVEDSADGRAIYGKIIIFGEKGKIKIDALPEIPELNIISALSYIDEIDYYTYDAEAQCVIMSDKNILKKILDKALEDLIPDEAYQTALLAFNPSEEKKRVFVDLYINSDSDSDLKYRAMFRPDNISVEDENNSLRYNMFLFDAIYKVFCQSKYLHMNYLRENMFEFDHNADGIILSAFVFPLE
ncbi:MAG: hypothetical protein Q6363_008060 [Candidatus Njordarchaeota archaeon]